MRRRPLIVCLILIVPFVACTRSAPSYLAPSLEPVVALAAAIAVMPVSEVNERVLVAEELRRQAGLDGPTVVALQRRIREIRWFETIEQARLHCDTRAGGCEHSTVKSIEKIGSDWRVVVSQSMLGGCGFQHFIIRVAVSSEFGVVRSVLLGESGSCGVRR